MVDKKAVIRVAMAQPELTLQKIANGFNCTREYVRQILANAGYHKPFAKIILDKTCPQCKNTFQVSQGKRSQKYCKPECSFKARRKYHPEFGFWKLRKSDPELFRKLNNVRTRKYVDEHKHTRHWKALVKKNNLRAKESGVWKRWYFKNRVRILARATEYRREKMKDPAYREKMRVYWRNRYHSNREFRERRLQQGKEAYYKKKHTQAQKNEETNNTI